jgi:glycosyltransferase involved in cell wall biosynthesis
MNRIINNYNLKISIGIPVYNAEKYIERCAISLFEQTYLNIEYIFLDDCTLDKSIEKIQNVLQTYPQRKSQTKMIKHEINKGSAAARNTIINNMTGDFVLWVDSDDYVETNMVELVVKKQQEKNVDIVCFGYFKHKKDNIELYVPKTCTSTNELALGILSREILVTLWTRMYKTDLFKQHNIQCHEGDNLGEDWLIASQLAYYAQSISNLDIPLYHYTVNSNTNSYSSVFSEEKAYQAIRNLDALKIFVSEKGPEWNFAWEKSEAKIIAKNIIDCCKSSEFRTFYQIMRRRANVVSKNNWKYVSYYFRIVFFVKNKKFIEYYVRMCNFLSKLTN